MSNKSASGFRRPARRFPARGWVLAEQTCIARGSPVHPKLACVEMPFPLGVLQDGDRKAKACTQPIQTIQRGENLFHNSSPSFKDASCPRPEKTSITQVSRIAQSCTKLCVAASHSSSAPTATCNLFSSLCSPPASGWADRRGTTYGATKITRDHFKLSSAASIAAQAPPRLPPYRYH